MQNYNSLQGVFVEITEYKSFLCADNINLFLHDEIQINKALKTVDKFSNVAGPTINRLKTEGMLLGSLKGREDTIETNCITWTNERVGCLGIYISNDKAKCDNLNWS